MTERNAQVACGVGPNDTLIVGAEPRFKREERREGHANTVASPYHGLCRHRHTSFGRKRSRGVRRGREDRPLSPADTTINSPWGAYWVWFRDDMDVGTEQVVDF